MRRQGSGDIINISSVVGRMGLPGSPAYISSKFALEGLTECLRYELGQFGIRTTLIEPGVVKTGFFDSMRIPESCSDPKYRVLTDHMLAGIKMMVEMGTPPSQVADAVIGAINDEEMLPRYVVGADAEDGKRFHLEDNAWVLVRFSGTEPLLRIYCEANDPELVQTMLDEAQFMLGV